MTLSDTRTEPTAAPPHSDRPAVPIDPCAPQIRRERVGSWIHIGQLHGFEWNHVRLPIRSLPPALHNLRILHLSDLHLRRRWSRNYDQLLERIQADPPDLLVFTGDFVENKKNHLPALPLVRRMVEGFRARLGGFAVTGNHDGRSMPATLAQLPIRLIEHQRVTLPLGDDSIELIGLVGFRRTDLNESWMRSLPPRQAGVPRIVLSHYPDSWQRAQCLEADLFLCGHTHGGQICLPRGIPLIRHDAMLRRYCKGIHRLGETWLVVNRGMGFSGLPVRLFCPSEVIDIRLIPG